MRTRSLGDARFAFVVGSALLAVVVAFQVLSLQRVDAVAGPVDPSLYRLPAEDRARLSSTATFGEPPSIALAAPVAQQIASGYYDPIGIGAKSVGVFLERISVPATARSDAPIVDRGVWIFRIAGMSQEQPGPIAADGSVTASHFLHVAYVFIDAATGELLFSEWQE
jgi:hypothetical protein